MSCQENNGLSEARMTKGENPVIDKQGLESVLP